MFAAYIIYNDQITDIIKYNNIFNKLNQTSIDKYIIGYNIQFSDNKLNIKILELNNNHDIKNNLLSFYAYKLFKNYTYCIELDFNFNQSLDLKNINQNQYNICSGFSTLLLNELFTNSELEVIKKLNKNINLSLFNNKIISNFKICNISSLHINTFYENIIYIYNKLLLDNINVSTIQLYTIYQLIYPNYITFNLLETINELSSESDEIFNNNESNISKKNIVKQNINNYKNIDWFVIRSHFKKLNNNTILSLKNTFLKKNKIRENKLDPKDKINFPIGKKLQLKDNQPFEYFYCVFYN
jgi:hypothetical protein